ncbi:MAG: DNA polymerase II, partial [Pseudomonadota bacterium]
RAALLHFQKLVQQVDPDVLTGWNVIDFDLSQLVRFATRLRMDLQLGREQGRINIRAAQGYFGSGHASIPGRVVLDGVDLLRGAFLKMDSYSLESAAQTYLGEGKVFTGTQTGEGDDREDRGRDKVEEILYTYQNQLDRFALYARTDARLVVDILDKLNLVDLAFARSRLTGMPPDRVAASIASFDFLYLNELKQRKIAAPSLLTGLQGAGPQSGGAVFEPEVGIHENVWVLDFQSLYPSIIRTYNIDPLGFVLGKNESDPLVTHSGARFSRSPSILKQMLDRLVPERAHAKARGDEVASQAIKILMNSCYGVLGTPACRFYNPELANAITGQGRYFLHWSKEWFESRGYPVLYGDTDSVFVSSGIEDATEAELQGRELVTDFNASLAEHIFESVRVHSHLELEFEKLYTKLFLAKVRGGSQGARKRYAGLRAGATEPEFVGMEVVRRDWTALAKDLQRGLFERLFDANTQGEELAVYVSTIVQQLRQGLLDTKLVYRRGLRKPVEEYVTNVPPHVQAVKKSAQPAPRIVRYLMTIAGPELVNEASSPIDREFYVERQIRPIAEPVLEIFGLNFDRAIGDDRQADLFG